MSITMPHWIDGAEYVEDGVEVLPIDNPATGEVVGGVAEASIELIDRAIASARTAQKAWGRASLAKRSRVMFNFRQLLIERQDELADVIVREGGKTRGDALGEIARGLEIVEFACGIQNALKGEHTIEAATGVDVHTIRQPVGVVGAIVPFNFPMMVPMWMHPMALATGNAVILKPATPVSHMLSHDGIDAVSFVGSTPVAKIVAAGCAASGKRFQALGGANNHAIVMPDANLDFAAQHIVSGAFGAAGQRCMALPVVVAVGEAHDPLIEKVKARAEVLKVGPGTDPANELGPVISSKSRERILSWINDAEAKGANVVLDGRGFSSSVEGTEAGNWVGPTIVDNVPLETQLYCEEVFGPVLVVIKAESYEEAIEIVNSGAFGNGSAIFTENGQVARQFQLDVNAGMVGINVPIPVPVGYYSFGGWKNSLLGDHKIHGQEGVNFYTRTKVITTRWAGSGSHGKIGLDFVATK